MQLLEYENMSASNLCRPLDPTRLQAPVFARSYPTDDYTLMIRPFCVGTDMDLLCGWLELQTGISFRKEEGPRPELKQSCIDILQSNHSQSLMCLLDDRPVCQADISKAPYNEVFMYLDTNAGDYAFRLIMSPYATVRNAYVSIVRAYLEYLFSFEEVGRVITYLPVYDEWSNHLLKNAGFRYMDTKKILSGVINLYECRRNKE
jgi:hypothetical protein